MQLHALRFVDDRKIPKLTSTPLLFAGKQNWPTLAGCFILAPFGAIFESASVDAIAADRLDSKGESGRDEDDEGISLPSFLAATMLSSKSLFRRSISLHPLSLYFAPPVANLNSHRLGPLVVVVVGDADAHVVSPPAGMILAAY